MVKNSDVSIPTTKFYTALRSLVKDGTLWAQCIKCGMVLSNQEFIHKNCNICGKLNLQTEILFRKKTEVC